MLFFSPGDPKAAHNNLNQLNQHNEHTKNTTTYTKTHPHKHPRKPSEEEGTSEAKPVGTIYADRSILMCQIWFKLNRFHKQVKLNNSLATQ